MTRIIALALLLSTGALADVAHDLAGRWVLDRKAFPDPRWTCTLEFRPDGHFTLHSTAVPGLVFKEGKDGIATSRSRPARASLKGTYIPWSNRLKLLPTPPLTQDQLDFAAINFGPPEPDGSYRPHYRLYPRLSIGSLHFTR